MWSSSSGQVRQAERLQRRAGAALAASASRVRRWLRNSAPPRCAKPRSSVVSTRRPRLTLARIGFSAASNASSVIENSVTRTGTTRLLLQMNSTSGASGGRISSVPPRASRVDRQQLGDCSGSPAPRAPRAAARCRPPTAWVLVGEFELVGRVDLGVELDRLDRRTLQAERLRALAAAVAADALDLVAARERVRVVLQRDDAPQRGRRARARPGRL